MSDKKTIVNDLYQAVVINVFAVGYSVLGKKILKMTKHSKFDLEDTGKLVAVVAASEMTPGYLIKQKILPEHNQCLKMASVAMLIGEALVNALAFTVVPTCFRDYPRIASTKKKRGMIWR